MEIEFFKQFIKLVTSGWFIPPPLDNRQGAQARVLVFRMHQKTIFIFLVAGQKKYYSYLPSRQLGSTKIIVCWLFPPLSFPTKTYLEGCFDSQ